MRVLMIFLTSMLLFACGDEDIEIAGEAVDDAANEAAGAIDEATDTLSNE